MKSFFLLIVGLFMWIGILGQTPQAFKYQAVARDVSGNVIANQLVSFRISIVPGSVTGGAVFSETHTKSTNNFGLIDLEIGNGSNIIGSISAIDWSSNIYFIKIEMDPSGGNAYQQMGTSQLLSVPYALHARSVELDEIDDADSDPENEIQTLSLSGNELSLSNGGTVLLPAPDSGDNWGEQSVVTDVSLTGDGTAGSPLGVVDTEIQLSWSNMINKPAGFDDNIDNVDDSDNDPVNELQTLSLLGNQLSLTPGGGAAVILPASEGGDNWGTQTALTDVTLSGDGTFDLPLKISRQGATNGQSLKWNGTTWLPGDDLTGNNLWTQSGDNIYFNTGKVGIGKNPGSDLRKFQVLAGTDVGIASNNNSTIYPAIYAENSSAYLAAIFRNGGGPVAWFQNNLIIQDGTQGSGKVLTSDVYGNTSWQTPSISPWSQNLSDIYYDDGNVGIGTESPFSTFHVDGRSYMNGGSVLFEGIVNSTTPANPPVAGSDTRMFWYPPKSALRAGTVLGDQWDKNKIGYYSAAFGYNTTAMGQYSGAFGNSVVAYGECSFASGNSTDATGDYSLAIGNNTEASGNNSVALGNTTIATGSNSVALGNATTASGTSSTALGWQSEALGSYSTAIGYSTEASGTGSFAAGLNTHASNNYTTTMGSNTTASGMYSMACGYNTIAPSLCEMVVGMYSSTYTGNPSSYVSTNRLFVVGNGTGTSYRSNALTILKNGNVGIGVDAPTYTLAVSGTAAKTGGGSWTTLSDIRLKDIQGEYSKGLSEIINLRPVWFTYKEGNPRQLPSDEKQIGFIAQEVQKVFPEAVNQCEDGYLDFNMHAINVALVNAVKELKMENDRLKEENEEILNRLIKLETISAVSPLK